MVDAQLVAADLQASALALGVLATHDREGVRRLHEVETHLVALVAAQVLGLDDGKLQARLALVFFSASLVPLGILPVRRFRVELRPWQSANKPAACWIIAFGSP